MSQAFTGYKIVGSGWGESRLLGLQHLSKHPTIWKSSSYVLRYMLYCAGAEHPTVSRLGPWPSGKLQRRSRRGCRWERNSSPAGVLTVGAEQVRSRDSQAMASNSTFFYVFTQFLCEFTFSHVLRKFGLGVTRRETFRPTRRLNMRPFLNTRKIHIPGSPENQ